MSRVAGAVERTLAPLDSARGWVLRALGPLARPFVVDRDLRVIAAGLALVVVALGLAIGVPLVWLLVAPVIWGVPHVAGDVRYLVARPGLHRHAPRALAVGAVLVASLVTASPALGGLAIVAAALTSPAGRAGRRALAVAVGVALAVVVTVVGPVGAIAIAHVHHVVALGLWWLWRRRTASHALVPLAVLAATGLVFSGVFDPWLWRPNALLATPAGVGLEHFERSLAPGGDPLQVGRWVAVFVFAQTLHYAVWLRLVPEDDRPRPTPRTFVASWRALGVDLGAVGRAAVVVGTLGVALWAVADLVAARDGYLRLALFHGWLELAAATVFFVEARRPGPTGHDARRRPERAR